MGGGGGAFHKYFVILFKKKYVSCENYSGIVFLILMWCYVCSDDISTNKEDEKIQKQKI